MLWFQQVTTLHIISRIGLKFRGVAAPEILYRKDIKVKSFLEVEAN